MVKGGWGIHAQKPKSNKSSQRAKSRKKASYNLIGAQKIKSKRELHKRHKALNNKKKKKKTKRRAPGSVRPEDLVAGTVIIEACKSTSGVFKAKAEEVKEWLDKVLIDWTPEIEVLVNPFRPRTGVFEVRVHKSPSAEGPAVSLQGLQAKFLRPLKTLDIEALAKTVIAQLPTEEAQAAAMEQ